MELQTLKIWKEEKLNRSRKSTVDSKRIERNLERELLTHLKKHIEDSGNDSVMIEVANKRVLGEFINILDNSKISSLYIYKQSSDNTFIFYSVNTTIFSSEGIK